MNYRQLGQTGLNVSTLGFGCGAVGGLMVKGDRKDMVQAVAYAIEHGITYFDTAAMYGNGLSETNLGQVLKELGAKDIIIGTKVSLTTEGLSNIEQALTHSVEQGLKRLGRDYVDLIQLHNCVSVERQSARNWVRPDDVEAAMQAFQKLHSQGKVGHWGFNGLGETKALHQVLKGSAQTVQSCFNLLNPTAGLPAPVGFPYQDYAQLIDRAAEKKIGVIAIRVLAAGALSGSASRAANAAQNVGPIASGKNFAEDVAQAQRFNFLIETGQVSSLVEAAIRFVITKNEVSTTMVGISNIDQLKQALEFTKKGPLPDETLSTLNEIWASFA